MEGHLQLDDGEVEVAGRPRSLGLPTVTHVLSVYVCWVRIEPSALQDIRGDGEG